jgi:hypothetical protein
MADKLMALLTKLVYGLLRGPSRPGEAGSPGPNGENRGDIT